MSRKTILSFLERALESEASLTPRQLKEVKFYLADFGETDKPGKFRLLMNPAVARYADSLFTVTVSPILGISAGTDGSVSMEERCEGVWQLWPMVILRSPAGQSPGSSTWESLNISPGSGEVI